MQTKVLKIHLILMRIGVMDTWSVLELFFKIYWVSLQKNWKKNSQNNFFYNLMNQSEKLFL